MIGRSATATWALGWALCCALLSPPALAETVLPSPSAALACMTPAAAERGAPEYEPKLVERKVGGTVAVELTFKDAQSPPQMRVTSSFVSDLLEEAVERHVRKFRVPCLQPGSEPVRILLSFVFLPNDGRKVMATAPRDADESRRQQLSSCLTRITGPARPNYPAGAIRENVEGALIVRLRFTSPTAPPQAALVTRPDRDRSLWPEVERFTRGYRLPCLDRAEFDLPIMFTFKLEGGDRTLIKDMSLRTLLGNAAGVDRPAYFDLGQLSCPFDVRMTYRQPHLPNLVGELDTSRPERRAFLDWLASVRLRLDDHTAERVLGDEFTVSVPCGKVDL